MAGIIAIYVHLKDEPVSAPRAGVLLTAANVLGKVASAALIVPTSEALGQLKWNWFHDSRAMWDFEIFDKASRGPWGAVMLLFRTRGRSLAALGALLIVLLLAIDTFFQQVTNLPTRSKIRGTGLIPRTVRYEPSTPAAFYNGDPESILDSNLEPVANNFFVSNGTQPILFGNGTRPDIPLSCPSESCDWAPYETLGICSQCADVSELLRYTCLNTRIDWTSELNSTISSYPNATVCGYFLNATSEEPLLMSGYALGTTGEPQGETLVMRTLPLITNPMRDSLWGGSIEFKDVKNPIIDVLISSTSGRAQVHAKVAPTLHECVVTWCVKTVKSTYSYGTYHESVTTIYQNKTNEGGSPWYTFVYPEGDSTEQQYLENVTIRGPSTSLGSQVNDWGVGADTMVGAVLVFDRFFPSFTTVANETANALLRWKTKDPTVVRTIDMKWNPWLLPNNISHHLQRLSTALTDVIRSDPNSNEYVSGNAFITETFVDVEWAWLTFPLALLLLSGIFLLATIIKTSNNEGIGIWKTSAMPTLIYSLPRDSQQDLTSSSTWSESETLRSKQTRIRLLPSSGWRISSQMAISTPPPARGHR
ncbi:hypothetical protein DE146DRAFT_47411 [Phaeosphaeria sp. MPI-PUGE-AT-0046c]|nr:hypothetical protein DE146DRAFT_47411 [Phaeosphaeria sp. MPI-PUGE-AT-0046c]